MGGLGAYLVRRNSAHSLPIIYDNLCASKGGLAIQSTYCHGNFFLPVSFLRYFSICPICIRVTAGIWVYLFEVRDSVNSKPSWLWSLHTPQDMPSPLKSCINLSLRTINLLNGWLNQYCSRAGVIYRDLPSGWCSYGRGICELWWEGLWIDRVEQLPSRAESMSCWPAQGITRKVGRPPFALGSPNIPGQPCEQ